MPWHAYCSQCGKYFGETAVVPCPNCGSMTVNLVVRANNYSGTVTASASNITAFESIENARKMLMSIASLDQKREPFVAPIIDQLSAAAEVVKKQEVELARAQKMDWTEYEKILEKYKGLLDKDAEEPDFQKFFEENAIFLEPKMMGIIPKKSLGGELIPDFLLVLHDSSYLFVEIEKPKFRLFNKKGNPTTDFIKAQQQIRDYLRWVSENKEFLRTRCCPSLNSDNFRGLLVIGNSSSLTKNERKKLENINSEVRSRYEIKTFDKILEENQALLKNFKQLGS